MGNVRNSSTASPSLTAAGSVNCRPWSPARSLGPSSWPTTPAGAAPRDPLSSRWPISGWDRSGTATCARCAGGDSGRREDVLEGTCPASGYLRRDRGRGLETNGSGVQREPPFGGLGREPAQLTGVRADIEI